MVIGLVLCVGLLWFGVRLDPDVYCIEINVKHQTTIVVVTHNPSFAQRMPRVVEMSDGKIINDQRGSLA